MLYIALRKINDVYIVPRQPFFNSYYENQYSNMVSEIITKIHYDFIEITK